MSSDSALHLLPRHSERPTRNPQAPPLSRRRNSFDQHTLPLWPVTSRNISAAFSSSNLAADLPEPANSSFPVAGNSPLHCQPTSPPRFFHCRIKKGDSNMTSELELGRSEERRVKNRRVNGIFWILLLNIGMYVADHIFELREIKASWYYFMTSTFFHANWDHLSSNLFFLYIFGKLVEEDEGNFPLWLSYILTGAGENLVLWMVLPRVAVSIGASDAVFGLFAIRVLLKMSWDWRKIIEVFILGQFVIDKALQELLPCARSASPI